MPAYVTRHCLDAQQEAIIVKSTKHIKKNAFFLTVNKQATLYSVLTILIYTSPECVNDTQIAYFAW